MDAAAIRWLLVTAGVVVLWLAWREVTAYHFGYSTSRIRSEGHAMIIQPNLPWSERKQDGKAREIP